MKLQYFGTDGIRGEYGGALLNDALAFSAGRAAAIFAKRTYSIAEPVLVVGRDTRSSGPSLEEALSAGFTQEGGRVLLAGVAPTPAVAFAVANSDAHMACAITASHNPHTDNGLKFFESTGSKLSESMEAELDALVGECSGSPRSVEAVPTEDATNLIADYCDALASRFDADLLSGKRVALDCANGAASAIAAALFERLGASVDVLGDEPNGSNINAGVGSECPAAIKSLYSKSSYDLGFAFDGDGDRVIAFDENGDKISGEGIMAALAIWMNGSERLPNATLVTTVQSNVGLDSALGQKGILVEREDIGDKHVSRKMVAGGFSLGGEESGHIINGAFSMTGDGVCSALTICQMIAATESSLSELVSVYNAFPQSSQAIKVAEKIPLEDCAALQDCMARLNLELGDEGRLLIRYSGTEPKLRLLVEAKEDSLVEEAMAELLAAAGKDLSLV